MQTIPINQRASQFRLKPPQQEMQLISKQVESKHPSKIYIFLFSYLYFMQGVMLALPETMTLVYKELPAYSILSLFSLAYLPFSIKFLTAPFTEKVTNFGYGKRKTWIIISQICIIGLLLISSCFTSQYEQILMGMLLFGCIFFTSLHDISLDALAIKELKVSHLVGLIQALFQTFGMMFGALFLLKCTSIQFAHNIGLTSAIAQPKTIFRCFAISIAFITLIIHCLYTETKLDIQEKSTKKEICSVISYYKIFFDFNSKYGRTILYFLISNQGFMLFVSGYQYVLIQKGFLRNDLNTFQNVSLIPVSILACFLSPKIQKLGLENAYVIYMSIKLSLSITIYISFPLNYYLVGVIIFFNQALQVYILVLIMIHINSFPYVGVAGMFVTMFGSIFNIGRLKSWALLLTGWIGWNTCALIGLCLQSFVLVCLFRFFKFINQGHLNLNADLLQELKEEKLIQTEMLQK